MIEFRLSIEALGRTAFGYSPMAEVACSLRQLAARTSAESHPAAEFPIQSWFGAARGRLDPAHLELLGAVAPPGKWVPDFFFAWSPDPKITIEEQLEGLARLPREHLQEDIGAARSGVDEHQVITDLLSSHRPGERLAEAISAYWRVYIQPHWPRMQAVLDDDLSFRGRQAMTDGILAVFEDLHPEVSVGAGSIFVDKPQHVGGVHEGGVRIALVPSIFVWPDLILVHHSDQSFLFTYSARGVARVWEAPGEDPGHPNELDALLGSKRAALLRRLEIPMSTSQLARLLGRSPGTVHGHLSVLKRNGLLESWRSGRSVLYRRTALASSIMAFSEARTASRSRGRA